MSGSAGGGRWTAIGAGILGLVLSTALGAADIFYAPKVVHLDSPPEALRVDDFNGDGRLDVAVAYPDSGEIGVLLGDPSESLPALLGTPKSYGVGLNPVFIVSGDLDGSGHPDLVVVNSGSGTISVLLNRGDGTFRDAVNYDADLSPRVADMGDLDRDGKLDVVTGSVSSKELRIFKGDGKGKLRQTGTATVSGNPHAMAVRDFDGDGKLDIVTTYATDDRGGLNFLEGDGDGTFHERVLTLIEPGTLTSPRYIATGDFDRDGLLDLEVVTDDQKLYYMEFQSDGTFDVNKITTLPVSEARFVVGADYDADGRLDLIAPFEQNGNFGVRVFRGAGDGHFSEFQDIFLGSFHQDLALRDLDGDGILDLVGTQSRGVTFARGVAPGRLGAASTILLSAAPRALSAADVNGDGNTDLFVLSSQTLVFIKGTDDQGLRVTSEQTFKGRSLQDMAIDDFNPDGVPEIALVDLAGQKVLVATLDASGKPGEFVEHSVGLLPERLAWGDLDGDGRKDLVVGHAGSSFVSVILRPGSPDHFSRVDIPVGSAQKSIHVADVNDDGALDLVVGNQEEVRVLYGDGKGKFARVDHIGGQSRAVALRTADLDSDGKTDLVIARGDKLTIFYSPGYSGTPGSGAIDVDGAVRGLEIRDMDGNGWPDLVATVDEDVVVVRNGGEREYGHPEHFAVGLEPGDMVLADLDGDGRIDCATADVEARGISILHGAVARADPEFLRGDTNSEDGVNLTDAITILEELFRGASTVECPDAADVDDDGKVNITDVIVLLGYLFQGGSAPPPPGPVRCGVDPTPDSLGLCRGSPCN